MKIKYAEGMNHLNRLSIQAAGALAGFALSAPAWAGGPAAVASLGSASLSLVAAQDEPAADTAPAEAPRSGAAFGDEGTRYWSIGAIAGFSGDGVDLGLHGRAHWFLADGFEFNLGLGGFYHAQDGDDAASINPDLGFRWHFHRRDWYSVYADLGIGILWSTADVPEDGTRVNFTPHAGIGATFQLPDTRARLDVGVGWHHISNASTQGTDDNPDRDGIAVRVGVIVPF